MKELILDLWRDLGTLEECLQRAADQMEGTRMFESVAVYLNEQIKHAQRLRAKVEHTVLQIATELRILIG